MFRHFSLRLAAQSVVLVVATTLAMAQDYEGPLMPHPGGKISTAFSNHFGPDAESVLTFTAVGGEALSLNYASTRGLSVSRDIRIADRQSSRTYVLGYAANMPRLIPNSTSLGISGASLEELRSTGRTGLAIAYDANLNTLPGELVLAEKNIKVPLIVENKLMDVPAVHVKGNFGQGAKTATADFFILDNKNNPMVLQSTIKLSWEKQPREERIASISAGDSMKAAMEQSLNTLKRYDMYGIHFDFGKATLRPDAAAMMDDIALTLKNNPSWTLQINGHTDSIGEPAFNKKLSSDRAATVARAVEKRGIAANRLTFAGLGETQPKGDNASLEGRALNRRVELVRTDK